MADKSPASRSDLLAVAKACCGDSENCGAIGFEIDQLQCYDEPETCPVNPPTLLGFLKRLGAPSEPRS
ncbi:MAG: hypothetical protein AAGL24_28275 [Pseudomonadota bacterium]